MKLIIFVAYEVCDKPFCSSQLVLYLKPCAAACVPNGHQNPAKTGRETTGPREHPPCLEHNGRIVAYQRHDSSHLSAARSHRDPNNPAIPPPPPKPILITHPKPSPTAKTMTDTNVRRPRLPHRSHPFQPSPNPPSAPVHSPQRMPLHTN